MPRLGLSSPEESTEEKNLPQSIFGGSPFRKSSENTCMLPHQNGGQAVPQNGPVEAISRDINRPAVSVNAVRVGPVPPPATIGAARFRNNAWTPGFEQAMKERQNEQRASVSVPIGPERPNAGVNRSSRPVRKVQQEVSGLATNSYSARIELGHIRDGIENAVEQQVADALGPIRLMTNTLMDNVHALGSIRQAIRVENDDLREQNDVLSRQIDLHYRDLRQQSETSSAHVRALAGLIEAHGHADLSTNAHVKALANLTETHSQINQAATENINRTTALVNQLTQIITSLPGYIGQALNRAIAQEYQGSSALIIAAQREAFDNILAFYSQQQSELESRETKLEALLQEFNTMGFADPSAGVETPHTQQEARDPDTAGHQNSQLEKRWVTAVEVGEKQEGLVEDEDIRDADGAEATQAKKPARKVGEKIKAMVKKVTKLGRAE